ncbi:hypothetical protein [Lactiplantibacillus pentosus]
MPFFKLKSRQLRPAGNSASYRKLAVADASYTGFQAFERQTCADPTFG